MTTVDREWLVTVEVPAKTIAISYAAGTTASGNATGRVQTHTDFDSEVVIKLTVGGTEVPLPSSVHLDVVTLEAPFGSIKLAKQINHYLDLLEQIEPSP